jgi:PAS domain S-box-containing protein
MPGMTGLEFLREVREEYHDLPFILFTGRGSEEVASDAISMGVTDYLQKGGTEQYELLANRITNAVDRYVIERERRQWKRAVETANEGIAILDADGGFVQMNDAYADAFDESPGAVVGTDWREWYPEDEVDRFDDQVIPALEREGTWDGPAVAQRAEGTVVDQQLSPSTLEDGGHVCVMEVLDVRDGG